MGETPAMREVFNLIDRVSRSQTTVLITGETGTGKELVARRIHSNSGVLKSFVAFNCGAIPSHLVEDELFGHVRGAFTDAKTKRIGRFEEAAGGTLFLDEVGELPLDFQVKFLRILEEREFQPLGSSKTYQVRCRILAATNCDLEEKVRVGEFRSDLFYRLSVFPIHMPPLREIREDIPLLANHLINRICEREGKPFRNLSDASLERLMDYPFPGNVRELLNMLELSCLMSDGRELEIPADSSWQEKLFDALSEGVRLPADGIDLQTMVTAIERSLMRQALERTGGNREHASRLLGLKRTTLVEKLKRADMMEVVQ